MLVKTKIDKTLFDEHLANRALIKNLIRELNRRDTMSKVLQDENGVLYLAHQFEKLAAEDVENLLNTLKEDVKTLENSAANDEDGTVKALAASDNQVADNGQVNPEVAAEGQPSQPAENAPADPSAAPADTQATPAEGDQTGQAEAAPAAPVAPPAEQAQPAAGITLQ